MPKQRIRFVKNSVSGSGMNPTEFLMIHSEPGTITLCRNNKRIISDQPERLLHRNCIVHRFKIADLNLV